MESKGMGIVLGFWVADMGERFARGRSRAQDAIKRLDCAAQPMPDGLKVIDSEALDFAAQGSVMSSPRLGGIF
jgi:hypothetical protein